MPYQPLDDAKQLFGALRNGQGGRTPFSSVRRGRQIAWASEPRVIVCVLGVPGVLAKADACGRF